MAFCFDRKCHLIGNGAVFCSSIRYQRGQPAAFWNARPEGGHSILSNHGIQTGFVTPTALFPTMWGCMDHGTRWHAGRGYGQVCRLADTRRRLSRCIPPFYSISLHFRLHSGIWGANGNCRWRKVNNYKVEEIHWSLHLNFLLFHETSSIKTASSFPCSPSIVLIIIHFCFPTMLFSYILFFSIYSS